MEIELKLSLDEADVARLLGHPLLQTPPTLLPLHAIYFDDAQRSLKKLRAGLRLRNEGGLWMQTLKSGGSAVAGLHRQHEWETRVDASAGSPCFDLASLAATMPTDAPCRSLLLQPGYAQMLEPLFEVEVNRRVWLLTLSGAEAKDCGEVEVALDQGLIRAGNEARSLCEAVLELELELKRGEPELLQTLADALTVGLKARPFDLSKAQRGHALAQRLNA